MKETGGYLMVGHSESLGAIKHEKRRSEVGGQRSEVGGERQKLSKTLKC
jgi:hypothetical protein